jgi:hypothetical protein
MVRIRAIKALIFRKIPWQACLALRRVESYVRRIAKLYIAFTLIVFAPVINFCDSPMA